MSRPAPDQYALDLLRSRYPQYAHLLKRMGPKRRKRLLDITPTAARIILATHPSIAGRSQILHEGGLGARGMKTQEPESLAKARKARYAR